MATAGIPLEFRWDRKRRALRFRFLADPDIDVPTEIYVPEGTWKGTPEIHTGGSAAPAAGLRAEYREAEQRIYVYNNGYRGEAVLRAGVLSKLKF
jgi:hypothetical protein